MDTAPYIDLLLEKYRKAPSFPFTDWASNAVSFYALMNLWDDIFKTAVGQEAASYVAASDTKMDPDSLIYDARTPAGDKAVSVFAEESGGTFHVIWSPAKPDYVPDMAHMGILPDRTRLGFATDIERARLIAAFDIIRAYARSDIATEEDAKAFDQACVARYAEVFGFDDYDPFENRRGD